MSGCQLASEADTKLQPVPVRVVLCNPATKPRVPGGLLCQDLSLGLLFELYLDSTPLTISTP